VNTAYSLLTGLPLSSRGSGGLSEFCSASTQSISLDARSGESPSFCGRSLFTCPPAADPCRAATAERNSNRKYYPFDSWPSETTGRSQIRVGKTCKKKKVCFCFFSVFYPWFFMLWLKGKKPLFFLGANAGYLKFPLVRHRETYSASRILFKRKETAQPLY
jgi:hypothetical protein